MKVIEDYLDILDDEILFEGDDGGLRNIISKLRRVKVKSSEKKEAKQQLKEIESTERFKNVRASIIKYSKNPTKEASLKLKDELKKELGDFAAVQIGTAISVLVVVGFMVPRKIKKLPIGIDLISSLICILASLPPILITRIFSKSGKKLVEIQNDIEANNVVSNIGMIETIVGFLLILPLIIPATTAAIPAASIGLIVISLSKMFVSLYVGLKKHRFDQK